MSPATAVHGEEGGMVTVQPVSQTICAATVVFEALCTLHDRVLTLAGFVAARVHDRVVCVYT